MKKRCSEFFKSFVNEEDGAELIQWAILIAIMAALAIVAWQIFAIAQGKLEGAKNDLEKIGAPDKTSKASK